jgi:hypothetical protein
MPATLDVTAYLGSVGNTVNISSEDAVIAWRPEPNPILSRRIFPMAEWRKRVEIDVGGRVVATADVERPESAGPVRVVVNVESGHLPTGSRTRLVDAMFDLPELQPGDQFEAAVPIGDAEILDRLRQRLADVRTRPAGATCLVEAQLPHPRAMALGRHARSLI